jgi:LuxR family transcriptional regulator, maltose regulon positive regulatory protein
VFEGWAGRAGVGVVLRPELFDRLGPARVTLITAPAGSGKTVLLRSWAGEADQAGRAALVAADQDERDPQQFWLSVLGAMRGTGPGSELVQTVSASPELDGWALVERLLHDLAELKQRLWLVVDDVHQLASTEALRQLELFVMRAPPQMGFVLATRHDLTLGLHRLRLEGGLAEIRSADLCFSLDEARELLNTAGVALPEPALAALHRRTEGWAAGLRLAALALAGHPDPARVAAEFSGGERTVAEYLLAEVLERQSEHVRRLLLRTSMVERLNGELADLLTGHEGGERILQDLEAAGALVVSLDAPRTWFRYHQLLADLLQLQLRRSAPGEIADLHRTAAGWFADHGFPLEAIRHAQAAHDWVLAARLLADHWPALQLDGHAASVHELVAAFPSGLPGDDAEFAVVAAADELAQGSPEEAERYLRLAERGSVPDDRRHQAGLLLGVVRLLVGRQRRDLPAVTEEATRLSAMAEAAGTAPLGLEEDLWALALMSLGTTELWAGQFAHAYRHLEEGAALARRIERPYLELTGLASLAAITIYASFPRATERAGQVIELAERHGWTDHPAVSVASMVLGVILAWQGRPEAAEPWVRRAERTLRAEADLATVVGLQDIRGIVELSAGRDADALAAFQAADRTARRLASPPHFLPRIRLLLVLTLVRLDETGRAGQFLDGLDAEDRERGEIRTAQAVLALAQGDSHAATVALAPVLDGSAPVVHQATTLTQAFLLEATIREALGDPASAENALERALDRAEPDGGVLPFLLHPAPDLLERLDRRRSAHASLIAEIQGLLRESRPALPDGPRPTIEPVRNSELRVLRYLPTNLTAQEIARELYVSQNTVKTHMRSLYAKLGAHRRSEAIERARALGLLAPSGAGPR